MAIFQFAFILGLFSFCSWVYGDETHELYERMIDDLWKSSDDDGDGVFSEFELIKTFSGYDTNGDGTITRHEYVNHVVTPNEHLHQYLHALFDIFDVNNDHHFNHHDYHGLYNKMDKDGDGTVTKDDFYKFWHEVLRSTSHIHDNGHHLIHQR